MDAFNHTWLKELGAGESIAAICARHGISQTELEQHFHAESVRRLPDTRSTRYTGVQKSVQIVRDRWGVPHITGETDTDLFFGLGFALAQDRLWQLDYYRRKAYGRLAEILGPEALPEDRLARIVGFTRIAAQLVAQLPDESHTLLAAFAGGLNAQMEESSLYRPIEFALLDYRPEPWTVLDTAAIWVDKRWYSSGRIPVIAMPEMAKRLLASEDLYRAYLTPEADDESILPPGSYPAQRQGADPVGVAANDPDEGIGSNNWVIAGTRTTSNRPMLASDPHNSFTSLSERYEYHLHGGSFNVAGGALVGVPAVLFGRNSRVAWGLTNNICSQRDLYQEQTSSHHPGCFLFDGEWQPAATRTEIIYVRGAEPVTETITFSRNGPIVDALLPESAAGTGPVSLRWVGALPSDEISCLLAANRAETVTAFRAALEPWHAPTWSYVFADMDGHIGYQCTGRIPIRRSWERGYRPGWQKDHQWDGLIPFDGMPHVLNPPRGWIVSANNRTAPEDYPYSLSGTWSSGYRAQRARTRIENQSHFTGTQQNDQGTTAGPPPGMVEMQMDVLSLRAQSVLPLLLDVLSTAAEDRYTVVIDLLAQWDGTMQVDSAAATIFAAFYIQWRRQVAEAQFPQPVAHVFADTIHGLALDLLSADLYGWFENEASRRQAILRAMQTAIAGVAFRLGPNPADWQWGKVHTITLSHPLSGRGDLGRLFDRGGLPARGDMVTLCNAGHDETFAVTSGAVYRLIVDLGASPLGLWSNNPAGQSGQPGSPNYCDQLEGWLAGEYHFVPLDPGNIDAHSRFTLHPVKHEQ